MRRKRVRGPSSGKLRSQGGFNKGQYATMRGHFATRRHLCRVCTSSSASRWVSRGSRRNGVSSVSPVKASSKKPGPRPGAVGIRRRRTRRAAGGVSGWQRRASWPRVLIRAGSRRDANGIRDRIIPSGVFASGTTGSIIRATRRRRPGDAGWHDGACGVGRKLPGLADRGVRGFRRVLDARQKRLLSDRGADRAERRGADLELRQIRLFGQGVEVRPERHEVPRGLIRVTLRHFPPQRIAFCCLPSRFDCSRIAAEFRYQPHGWPGPRRFVTIRRPRSRPTS